MAEKILDPFGRESFGLQKARDGVPEQMRVQVSAPGVGIYYAGGVAGFFNDAINHAEGYLFPLTGNKNRPLFPIAEQVLQVAQVLVVNNRHDASLAAFALAYQNALAIEVDVAHIQLDQFFPAQPQPIQSFNNAPVAKVAGRDDELFNFCRLQMISRRVHLLFHSGSLLFFIMQ